MEDLNIYNILSTNILQYVIKKDPNHFIGQSIIDSNTNEVFGEIFKIDETLSYINLHRKINLFQFLKQTPNKISYDFLANFMFEYEC